MVDPVTPGNAKKSAALSTQRTRLVHVFAGCGCSLLHCTAVGLAECHDKPDFDIQYLLYIGYLAFDCSVVLALNCCTVVVAFVLAVKDLLDCVACFLELLA